MSEEKKVDEALEYAESSNKIEDLNLNKEELKEIKEALVNKRNQDSFLFSIVEALKKKEQNDKIK